MDDPRSTRVMSGERGALASVILASVDVGVLVFRVGARMLMMYVFYDCSVSYTSPTASAGLPSSTASCPFREAGA